MFRFFTSCTFGGAFEGGREGGGKGGERCARIAVGQKEGRMGVVTPCRCSSLCRGLRGKEVNCLEGAPECTTCGRGRIFGTTPKSSIGGAPKRIGTARLVIIRCPIGEECGQKRNIVKNGETLKGNGERKEGERLSKGLRKRLLEKSGEGGPDTEGWAQKSGKTPLCLRESIEKRG